MSALREIISVGIDIGTTTTQVVFSKLVIGNTARPGQVPRLGVQKRSVLYESPIWFTPLSDPYTVDTIAITEIIRNEYRSAGINPKQVESGAVIITGEIARTHNADKILESIASLAGDFVVSVAGPNLEAQIAGRGSSAAAYSLTHYTQVTNVDIGGGTSNAAVFRNGLHLSSSAVAVGGRQLIIEKTSGNVKHIAPPGKEIIQELGLPIREGKKADLSVLTQFCDCMAEIIVDLILGIETPLGKKVQLSPPLKLDEPSKVIFISGGVGAYYYQPVEIHTLADVLIHNDVGPLLAQSLRLNARLRRMQVEPPSQTMRATVLGAATQTVTLSGSTIWVDESRLPLRNIPVVYPAIEREDYYTAGKLSEKIRDALTRWDKDFRESTFAISLKIPDMLDYPKIVLISEELARFAQTELSVSTPLILVLENDYAQVLGQLLHTLMPQRQLISID